MRGLTIAALMLLLFVLVVPGRAATGPPRAEIGTAVTYAEYPTSAAARRWKPKAWWLREAFCVHNHESTDWHRAGIDWRGLPSPYYGGMQFLIDTWRRAGGRGLPSDWSVREQVYRAWVIYRSYGDAFRLGSWLEWGTAWRCGLA